MTTRVDRRVVSVCVVLLIGSAGLTLAALALGDFPIPLRQVLAATVGRADAATEAIVLEWRLPRALAALVFGAALGLSGAIFQSLTRNPLASPDVIGFSSGSYFGALVVLLVLGGGHAATAGGAILGGFGTAVVIYLLALRRGMQGFRLIVVGIAVSAMLGSASSYLMLVAKLELAMQAAIWGVGSLASVTGASLGITTAAVALLVLALACVGPSLRELELGDELAVGHGVRVRLTWTVAVIVGVCLTAVVTAAVGPIAFLSLAVPQIARRLAGTGGTTLVTTACLGACLLAAADLVSQHALPKPVPVGLVTVVLGGAYLAGLIVRERNRT